MTDPTIVFAPLLDADVRSIADELRPPHFEFQNVPLEDVPAAIQSADFLCGFIGPIDTQSLVSAAANRLKLVQLMSVGYDRFNLDGARAARLPVAVNGGANAIAVAEHAIMLML
ncbi:MAG: hypothetical protein M3069_26400, partial [Chloroflexota bacterium]|nr:hypothetical protein [Chloroflexota bacterium]